MESIKILLYRGFTVLCDSACVTGFTINNNCCFRIQMEMVLDVVGIVLMDSRCCTLCTFVLGKHKGSRLSKSAN